MAIEWAGWGPQLLLSLDRESGTPLKSQVEQHLRAAIRDGRLAGGERLPSSRALAGHLGLSRGLIQECYAQLQAEGYLTAHTGSETRGALPAGGKARPHVPEPGGPAAPP